MTQRTCTDAQPCAIHHPLHIYTVPKTRTRRHCPYHKRLHYGNKQEYYDTIRVFFDCGTEVDYGYGYYRPPQEVLRKRWREAKRRQRARPGFSR